MGETKISQALASDMTNEFVTQADVTVDPTYKVDPTSTDGVGDQRETEWMNPDWTKYLGYYKKIPEIKLAIDAKATWTVGKGFTADPITTLILDTISGWGKDTFNTIIENLVRTYHIGGDAFAEIIRDKNDVLINLKPLDPEVMKIIVDEAGRIIRYEQMSKSKSTEVLTKFTPDQIFHLARNRVADEIHGESAITAVEKIILFKNEVMDDWKRVLHRNIDPVHIFKLDTDNTTEIANFKAKMDAARGKGENMYIPKDAVEIEQDSMAPNSTLTPLATIDMLNSLFYQAVGVPAIIAGVSGSLTEASAKMEYLVFEQNVEEEQLFVEEQVLTQLNLVINLEFPASLQNELLSGKPKVEEPGINQKESGVEGNDTTAELEGRR